MKRGIVFLAAAVALTACRIPLKKPPISMVDDAPRIDWARLAEFAQAASDVYLPEADLEKKYGKDAVIVRDLPHTNGRACIFLNHKKKFQTIAMRGTSNETNVLSDLDSVKVRDEALGIFLHRGFKRAADDVYADLKPMIQRDYPIRITGHSLGGAIAVILAMHLEKDGYNVEEVLTFGQPKVTNDKGGLVLRSPYFRVINDQDVVPQLPPSNLILDLSGPYEHFGPEITLYKDKRYTYSPVHIPRDLISGNLLKTIRPEDVEEHQIANYIARIKALE